MKRSEWWVMSISKRVAFLECEGFRSRKAAEEWRDEHGPEWVVMRVDPYLIPEPKEPRP
jgi:hypothetical protein